MASPQAVTGGRSNRRPERGLVRARNGRGISSAQAIQTLSAVSIGTHALHALGVSSRGRVAAAFNRSRYLELDGGWCCLVAKQLGAGPVNICALLPGRLDLVARNAAVDTIDQGFVIGNRLHVVTATARVWTAPVVEWSAKTLVRGLAALDPLCLDRAPIAGLSRIVWPRSSAARRPSCSRIVPSGAICHLLSSTSGRSGARCPIGASGSNTRPTTRSWSFFGRAVGEQSWPQALRGAACRYRPASSL